MNMFAVIVTISIFFGAAALPIDSANAAAGGQYCPRDKGLLAAPGATSNADCKTSCRAAENPAAGPGKYWKEGTYAPDGYKGDPPDHENDNKECCCSLWYIPTVTSPDLTFTRGVKTGCDSKAGLMGQITCKLQGAGEKNAKYGAVSLAVFVGRIIGVLLGVLGVLFLCLIVYAGFMWITAAGEEKKVGEAISIINKSLFGLLITAGAYMITVYVVNVINTSAGLP